MTVKIQYAIKRKTIKNVDTVEECVVGEKVLLKLYLKNGDVFIFDYDLIFWYRLIYDGIKGYNLASEKDASQ